MNPAAWIPVTERLPKKGECVDIYSESHGRLTDYKLEVLSEDNKFFSPVYSGVLCVRDATHWMPVPGDPE